MSFMSETHVATNNVTVFCTIVSGDTHSVEDSKDCTFRICSFLIEYLYYS